MLLGKEQQYEVVLGDCITEMAKMPERSFDFSVFSPPFSIFICLYQ